MGCQTSRHQITAEPTNRPSSSIAVKQEKHQKEEINQQKQAKSDGDGDDRNPARSKHQEVHPQEEEIATGSANRTKGTKKHGSAHDKGVDQNDQKQGEKHRHHHHHHKLSSSEKKSKNGKSRHTSKSSSSTKKKRKKRENDIAATEPPQTTTKPSSSDKSLTQFRIWKESTNGGGKTTLEQQIDLASRLWDESLLNTNQEPKSHAALSSVAIVQALKKTPIKGCNSLVAWKGFRVGWFLNVFCKTPYMQKLIDFGCELWFVRKVCIIEIIRQAHCAMNGSHDKDVPVLSDPFVDAVGTILGGLGLEGNADGIVQPPTTFISYTGGYTLQETLEVLQQLDPNEYIWMDIFCVNQFAWTGKSRSPDMQQFKDTFLDDLQDRIMDIGKTALILEKWDDVMRTLEQIWVLWEIFNTADTGTELKVLLPHEQTQDFVAGCLESREKFETIMASLASVDANKARAEDDDDRAKIFARIQESGVSKVNNLATSAMRIWMQKQGTAWLEEQRKGGGEGPSPEFLHNLAKLLKDQGKLEEAEPLYREALEMDQKVMGPDHPNTLTSINNLALLLQGQGKLDEAESLYWQALEKQQNVLGPDHPDTLTYINNLAVLLHDQGKLEQAEPLYQQALEKQQKLLGPDHPDTLQSLSNLAELLRTRGKLEEAEPLYREALEKQQKVLGPDHPSTLNSINNLALLLYSQGKLEEAEPLYRQVLEKEQKLLGPDHPDTLASINNLAGLLHAKGWLDEAEPLYRKALEKRQKVLGPDHPSTLVSINNLANLLQDQGKLEEAEPLCRQAFEKRQKVLGPDHPHTLSSINNLAVLLEAQGKLEEAEPLYRQALEKRHKVLGPDNPDTLGSMYNLADILYNKGDTAEAKILLRDCLEKSRRVLGQDHPHTINYQQALDYWFGGTDSG